MHKKNSDGNTHRGFFVPAAPLRNALGQEVRRVALRPAGGQAEVSVAGLPAGVYAVQVLGAGVAAVRRVVVGVVGRWNSSSLGSTQTAP